MPLYRSQLPQLDRVFMTDGGLETTLVFLEGIDLPCFAAFPLVLTVEGRTALTRYFRPYLELAQRHGTGIVLDAPTWRANADWGEKLGFDAEALAAANRAAIDFVADLRTRYAAPESPVVLNGVIGPRGDGYRIEGAMSAAEAHAYHASQMAAFRDSEADMVSAITMTYAEEAIGIALAARERGLPAVVSFTLETDGRLPSGQDLGAAIAQTDATTGGYPVYYMVNCAHPRHFEDALADGAPWLERIRGIRANASEKSHAELDAATELDIGDPLALGQDYARLRRKLTRLCVVGGCCGTDHRHVAAICKECLSG
jgi:S-methylmethionine-dependent homocysteine/selenocysteine methylase